jgi:chitodextrinase
VNLTRLARAALLCISMFAAGCGSPTTKTNDTPVPTAPQSLEATAVSSSEITVAWSPSTDSTGVTGYMLERCQGTGCTSFVQIATPAGTAYDDTGLAASATYSYRVRAINNLGSVSGYSPVGSASTAAGAPPPDTTPPTAPANPTATAASSTQINLAWTASTDNVGVSGYRLERCGGAGCTSFAQIAMPAGTGFSDTGLTGSTSYSYRLRATDAAGNLSTYSAVATASTQAPPDTTPPTAPTNPTATAASFSQINVSWTASTDNVGVTGYRLERCSGAGCTSFAQIATPAGAAYSDTGLTASTYYAYRVRATDAAGNLSTYSAVATTSTPASNISVSVTPVRGGLTLSQALAFTATVTNDVATAGVTWSATLGSFSAQSTTTAMYVAPGTAGQVTITATSVADSTQSASATLGITDLGSVATYHNDLARDGANTHEFALTPANVNTATFGKLFSCTVDGSIYAQPLWVANVTIGGAKHNVIVVATQHDSVYAFDADSSPCTTLWHASLLDAAHGATTGETTVPSGTANTLVGAGYGDIKPEIGVTGTPVIDPASNTLYVVSKSAINNALPVYQRLHALNLIDGTEKNGGPVGIDSTISVAGTGAGSVSSRVSFDPLNQAQRAGLVLSGGVVYVAWGSHEDHDPYHGWVMGFNASTLALIPNAVLNTTPNAVSGFAYSRGGVWMSGGAPAVDASGNLYLNTGNGTFDASSGGSNFGDSTLKLGTSAGLTVADWFTPADQASLDASDRDHGSGGALILVSGSGGSFVIGGGKEGTLFLLQQSSLGQYGGNANPVNSNAYQYFNIGHGIFSTAAFWNNSLYISPAGSGLQSYAFDPVAGTFNSGAAGIGGHSISWPGSTPSISAPGASSGGIVWTIDSSPYCTQQSKSCGPEVLYALDAGKVSTELWNSSTAAGDQAGNAVKFTAPTVANGKVYIGTRGNDTGAGTSSVLGELDVYGLKPN